MATTDRTAFDRTTEDTGNVVSLDHLNVTIADQPTAILFYIMGLGLTRDPYMTVGLDNMWLNAGRQQFHVPTRPDAPQVVRGRIGMVVPDLDGLRTRLEDVEPQLSSTWFGYEDHGDYLEVTCPWGNRFHCTGPVADFGASFGVPYVEFNVPTGTTKGIAGFYRTILGAKSAVHDVGGRPAAVIHAGPDQSMVFREDPDETRAYDGHHVAVYIGDFSGPHAALMARDLVWQETNEHQYRFSKIVDPESGELLYELEHEVRSLRHPMYQRVLVNRDPAVNMRNYSRSAEYLNIG
jgi:hypothetical protein